MSTRGKRCFAYLILAIVSLIVVYPIATCASDEPEIKTIIMETDQENNATLMKIEVAGTEAEDVNGFYLDEQCLDTMFMNKRDEGKVCLTEKENGFTIEMEIDDADKFDSGIFQMDTTFGILTFDLKNAAIVKEELPEEIQEMAKRQKRARARGNRVIVYGKISIKIPTNSWWASCKTVTASSAYVRIRRTLSPAIDHDTYTDSYGHYVVDFENYGGQRVVFSAKKNGYSDAATVSLGTSGIYARKVNMTIPMCR